jgi:hypothetical protein
MRKVVGIGIGIAVVAAIVYATMGQLRVSCEVCMTYRGGQVCESARAADRDQATQQARTAACTRLSGGVTDGIQCNNTRPLSVRCTD